jgi:hypothetical protein
MNYFILGFFLATLGVTILESVCEILSFVVELVKAKISTKIAEYNSVISSLSDNRDSENTHVIGFRIEPKDSEEEEDDDI